MIFTKSTFSKKYRKNVDFGVAFEAQTKKNREKMVLKNMCFSNIDFLAFFFDFLRFGVDFGRPWAFQKSIKNRKNRVRGAFGTRSVLKEGSGRVLGGF